jgi:hypothetical protein
VSAPADSLPKLNVGSSCDAARKGAIGAGRDKEACMGDELAAQEMLVKIGRSIFVLRRHNMSA